MELAYLVRLGLECPFFDLWGSSWVDNLSLDVYSCDQVRVRYDQIFFLLDRPSPDDTAAFM